MTKKNKCAPQDLTKENLPHNRRELFFDILKQRTKLLFVLGLFLVISMLPSLIVFFFRDFSLQNLYGSYDWANITNEQIAEYNSIYRQQTNFWNLFQLPCFILIAIYLAGFMRIIRQLNYGSGIYLGNDLKTGIKQNSLHYILIAIITFVIFYLTSMVSNIEGVNVILRYLPIGLSIIIFVPVFLNMMSLSATYKLKFRQSFKNGFILGLKNILWYLIFIVALFAPILLFLIPYYLIVYVVFFVLSILYYPILFLANYLFNYASFDKYINKENNPEYYRKGLY